MYVVVTLMNMYDFLLTTGLRRDAGHHPSSRVIRGSIQPTTYLKSATMASTSLYTCSSAVPARVYHNLPRIPSIAKS